MHANWAALIAVREQTPVLWELVCIQCSLKLQVSFVKEPYKRDYILLLLWGGYDVCMCVFMGWLRCVYESAFNAVCLWGGYDVCMCGSD